MRQTPRAIALTMLALAAALRAQPIDLGTRQELFVDRQLIDSLHGDASLRLNPPTKREVVLVLDHPPEDATSAYFTVLQDGAKIRLYYRGNTTDDASDNQTTCYAESTDGIHFHRPNLGLYEWNGSTDNHICYRGPESAAFAPFKDENPDAKPDERYKAVCYRVLNAAEGSVFALASPDGIRWRRMSEKPILPPGTFDSLNTAHWDPTVKKYRLFGRHWTGGGWTGFRGIQVSESADFRTWSKPVPVQYDPGVPLEHFYTNAVVRAPGAQHILLSFPMRFVPDRKPVPQHPYPGVSDAVFMSSRDGVHWDRTFREPWIAPGPDPKNWTERSNMPAWGIVQTSTDEWSMYVSEHYRWPDNRLRRVTIPRGRLASVHAGVNGGELITKPVTFAGKRLLLNFATSAVGEVRAALLDTAGKALAESDPLFGDDLDRPVTWKNGFDPSSLAGRPVRLRLTLNDADVYAFRFAE